MKTLSLFDGISCGKMAFNKLGIFLERYDAFEIDKFAIQTSQLNFPDIIRHGDVFENDFTQFKDYDFVIGESPCQFWSAAKVVGRETKADGFGWRLFQRYVNALNTVKPKFFLYENNKSMSDDVRSAINEAFGFEAVEINSALLSAQNRKRLYWVGKLNQNGTYDKVEIPQPNDLSLTIKDILISPLETRKKIEMPRSRICKNYVQFDTNGKGQNSQQDRAYFIDGKFGCLPSARADTKVKVTEKGLDYCVNLTLEEAKRLQTVPGDFEIPMYHGKPNIGMIQLGNGWTVDVIAHILKECLV